MNNIAKQTKTGRQIPKNWNDTHICRIMTGWHILDTDQTKKQADRAALREFVANKLNAQRLVAKIHEAGAQVFYFHARSVQGNFYYNTKLGHKYSVLGQRDLVAEITEACRQHSIASVAMFQIVPDTRAYAQHPEWSQVNHEGQTIPSRLCFNNPERRSLILAQLAELARNYPLDGIMLDEFDFNSRHGGGNMCYCPSCQKMFKAKYGQSIPHVVNWKSSLWKNFIQFRFDSLTDLIKDVRQTIQRENPDILLTIVSYSIYSLPWQRLQPAESFAKHLDYFSLDITGPLQTSMTARFFRAYSRQKPEVIAGIVPFLGHMMHEFNLPLKPQCVRMADAMAIIANGASYNMDIVYHPIPKKHILAPEVTNAYREIAAAIRQREPWLQGRQESLAETALFYSEPSKIFYAQDKANLYLAEFFGFYKALLENHTLFDIIGARDLQLDRLRKYRVLVLPNAVCLTQAQLRTITAYVHAGGRVIATYKTSMSDDTGKMRKTFGLAKLLQVDFNGEGPGGDFILPARWRAKELPDYSYMQMHRSHRLSHGIPEPCALLTPLLRVQRKRGGQVAGKFLRRALSQTMLVPGAPATYTPEDHGDPLVITAKTGRGHTIYCAAKIGALYGALAIPYAGKLIANCLARLNPNPSIIIDAPACIEATAYRQDQRRIIVHLVNYQSQPQREGEFIQIQGRYSAPSFLTIHNAQVEIKLKKREKLKRAYLAPEMRALAPKIKNRCLQITIPQVTIHSILVVELEFAS